MKNPLLLLLAAGGIYLATRPAAASTTSAASPAGTTSAQRTAFITAMTNLIAQRVNADATLQAAWRTSDATPEQLARVIAVVVALAALETGWGTSTVWREGHNPGGIRGTGPAGTITGPVSGANYARYTDDAQGVAVWLALLIAPAYRAAWDSMITTTRTAADSPALKSVAGAWYAAVIGAGYTSTATPAQARAEYEGVFQLVITPQ